nr:hypothetical protein [uncultured Aminipila sp.]
MKVVYKNFSLGAIEENITTLIKECEIWSDLDLSYDEYEILSQKIFEVTNEKSSILQMQKSYPLVNITHAVNLVIHEEYEDFWRAYSEKLGITINSNQKIILGKNWKLIFKKLGFNKFNNDIKDMSMMPIISQAGIPNSEIEDIFDMIKYSGMQEKFEPKVLMDELTSWRSYAVGLSTKSYINLYPERAVKFFMDINELLNLSDNIEIDEEKYSERVIKKFKEWKEKEKYIGRKRPKNTEVPSPYLIYNQKENQFSMVLPPYSVKNEYAHYMNYKIVDSDYNRYEGKVAIRSDGQGRYIKQLVIPVNAARAYSVHWYDDTDETNPMLDKKITGVLGYGHVIFDCNGQKVDEEILQENCKTEETIFPIDFKAPILENIRYRDDFGKQNKAIIYWDARKNYPVKSLVLKQLNNYAFSEEIDTMKCKQLKAASGEKDFICLKNKLESGVYKVCDADDCRLSNEFFTPIVIDDIHIFKHREEGYKENIGSLNEILITTLMNYDSIKMLEKLKIVVKETGAKRDSYLDSEGCEILALLLCNFCGQDKDNEEDESNLKSNNRRCAQMIEEILHLISLHMLNTEQRGFILENMCRYHLSQKEFEICFEVLNLQMASFRGITEMSVNEIEKLAQVNDIAAMRLYLKNPMDYKQGMKLLGLTGIDAIREMLQFNETTATPADWLANYEELVKGNVDKLDYKFCPTSKITGNHTEFHDMVNWGVPGQYKSPEINFDLKHSEGIPFCGQLYLDVLLSWYMDYRNKSEQMTGLVKELGMLIASIDKAYMSLNQEIKNSIILYEKSLSARYIEGKSVFATFYYCGLASVMLALHGHIDLDPKTLKICDRFIRKMNQLFPELVERDLLLADMYVMFNK